MNKPELMSPAGHWPQLESAISAGADAVYFGLQHFSARAKVGFTLEELPDVIKTLHRHAVKGFVTFNTLVFDHELDQAAQTIEAIARSGADAIIVQDIGVAQLASQIAPNLEIHGSTQMSITSAEGAELAASLGCSRVVLGRELDLADIRRIANATDVELEVFVHGALCVSYSGQCFSSEAWGGRSANRGQCAQACRLSYDLIVDGQKKHTGDSRYLLSPGDLYAIEQIPEMIEIGVACFKIEGRYKNSDYVTLTTRAYRQAIDAAFAEPKQNRTVSVSKDELEQIYSRGLGSHFISGTNHQTVVAGRAPRHRGLNVGTIDAIEESAVVVDTSHRINRGDGIVFDSAAWRSPDETEEGGNVFDVEIVKKNRVKLTFGTGKVDFQRIRKGDLVWRTNDPRLLKKIRQSAKKETRTTGIRFKVRAVLGHAIQITAVTENDEAAEFTGQQKLSAAKSQSLDLQTLTQQFSRLGNTPFHLLTVALNSEGDVFCPVSVLNQARREIVDQFLSKREKVQPVVRASQSSVLLDRRQRQHESEPVTSKPQLHLLVRNSEQLRAAIAMAPASITLDYLELYGLRPSIERIKQAGIVARVASPRILKPSEQKIVRFLLSLDCQILVRSGGLLHDFISNFRTGSDSFPELHGDFSLNAANAISFASYSKMGLRRIAPTHDLNAKQIVDLAASAAPHQLEVIAFHHLPVFHTEHCLFCRFLSDGTDNTNCGHPCEKHSVSLQDTSGRRHAVLADVGCRNTVFGAEAQSAAKHLGEFIEVGIRHFRLEFVDQDADAITGITNSFNDYFCSKIDSEKLNNKLQAQSTQGTTEGSLYVPKNFKQLVQLD